MKEIQVLNWLIIVWFSIEKYLLILIFYNNFIIWILFLGNYGEMERTISETCIMRLHWNHLCLDQVRRKMEHWVDKWSEHSSYILLLVSWWKDGPHLLSSRFILLSFILDWATCEDKSNVVEERIIIPRLRFSVVAEQNLCRIFT